MDGEEHPPQVENNEAAGDQPAALGDMEMDGDAPMDMDGEMEGMDGMDGMDEMDGDADAPVVDMDGEPVAEDEEESKSNGADRDFSKDQSKCNLSKSSLFRPHIERASSSGDALAKFEFHKLITDFAAFLLFFRNPVDAQIPRRDHELQG